MKQTQEGELWGKVGNQGQMFVPHQPSSGHFSKVDIIETSNHSDRRPALGM